MDKQTQPNEVTNPLLLLTVTFTPEEDKEFTYFNLGAFSLALAKATAEDTILPCWLCLSPEAKKEYRDTFAQWCVDKGITMFAAMAEYVKRPGKTFPSYDCST